MDDADEQAARAQLVRAARRMEAGGLSPGSSGNLSVRREEGILITPSGLPPAALAPDDLVVLAPDGAHRRGRRAPSSEVPMHLAVYRARPEVRAVVHTHARHATMLACLRRPIPAVHYMIAGLGTRMVPCADYATFGSEDLSERILAVLGEGFGCLLANHGALALGRDLEHAVRSAELLEWLAEIHLGALRVGEPVILGDAEMEDVERRFREGYGQPAAGGGPEPTGRTGRTGRDGQDEPGRARTRRAQGR